MLDWYSATHTTTVVGLYLSTLSGLSILQPKVDSSDREPARQSYDPVIHFPSLPMDVSPLNDMKLSLLRPYCAGRPLWLGTIAESIVGHNGVVLGSCLQYLVDVALFKLTNNNNRDKFAKLALFYSRFCFGYISTSVGETLTHKYMATLFAVRKGVYACHYPVEPILAEASAKCTSKDPSSFAKAVDAAATHIHDDRAVEASVGDCGELAGAVALAAAMDAIRARGKYNAIHNNMSRDVPVKTFLKTLFEAGNDINVPTIQLEAAFAEDQQLYAEFDDWTVNFTNFARLPTLSDDIIQRAYSSRTAFVLKECTPCSDILVIMNRKSGEYSYILVQVKNYHNSVGTSGVIELLEKQNAKRCGLAHIQAFCNPPCCVSLLMMVGKGTADMVCRLGAVGRDTRSTIVPINQLQVSFGLNNINITQSVREAIKNLAKPFRQDEPRFGMFTLPLLRAMRSNPAGPDEEEDTKVTSELVRLSEESPDQPSL
jgi:hypothetical protein